jgi:laminin alpha 1/2
MMMVALQNVQHILIRATDSMDRIKAELKDVSLEVDLPTSPANSNTHRNSPSLARGVETCQCPLEYTGGSCQNPHRGYYRRFKYDYVSSTVLIDLVGDAQPFHCNGRSLTCDRETKRCTNCRESTMGDHCQ